MKTPMFYASALLAGGLATVGVLQGFNASRHNYAAEVIANSPSFKMAGAKYTLADKMQTELGIAAKQDEYWTNPRLQSQAKSLHDRRIQTIAQGQQLMPRAQFDELSSIVKQEEEQATANAGRALTDLALAAGLAAFAYRRRNDD